MYFKNAKKIAVVILCVLCCVVSNLHIYNSKAEEVNATNWMSNINGSVGLMDLSIPGTHDSGTSNVKDDSFLSSIIEQYAKCQDYTIQEQLNLGVRYLDLRIQWDNNQFELCHGTVNCFGGVDSDELDLITVLQWTLDFLKNEASKDETIIYQIRDENGDCIEQLYTFFDQIIMQQQNTTFSESGSIGSLAMSDKLKSYVGNDTFVKELKDRIYLGTDMPKLKDVRGKIVILSRLKTSTVASLDDQKKAYYSSVDDNYWAFDTYDFPEGSNYTMEQGGSSSATWELWVEDQYELDSTDEKWKYVEGSLTGSNNTVYVRNQAREKNKPVVCVVFSSMNKVLSISPKAAADAINPKLSDMLEENTNLYTGCLLTDFGDASLYKQIYETNFETYGEWSEITYTWNELKCTASRYAVNDSYYTESETVDAVTSLLEDEDSTTLYTADFENTSFVTQQNVTSQSTYNGMSRFSSAFLEELEKYSSVKYALEDSDAYTDLSEISDSLVAANDYVIKYKALSDNGATSIEGKYTLTINKAVITSDSIQINSSFEYDGTAKSPVVTVSLINNAEYTVTYYKDSEYKTAIDTPQMTDIGSVTYYFTINDKDGNYETYKGQLTLTVADTGGGSEETHKNIDIYRLYNNVTGEHLFTAKENEYNKLGEIGWIQEGKTFIAYKEDDKTDDAVAIYRLFNPNGFGGNGDHHYTKSQGEITKLIAAGWKLDFGGSAAFYVTGDISVYKLYDSKTGAHHYTPKNGEANKMSSNGWKNEGIGWSVEGYYNNNGDLITG